RRTRGPLLGVAAFLLTVGPSPFGRERVRPALREIEGVRDVASARARLSAASSKPASPSTDPARAIASATPGHPENSPRRLAGSIFSPYLIACLSAPSAVARSRSSPVAAAVSARKSPTPAVPPYRLGFSARHTVPPEPGA